MAPVKRQVMGQMLHASTNALLQGFLDADVFHSIDHMTFETHPRICSLA